MMEVLDRGTANARETATLRCFLSWRDSRCILRPETKPRYGRRKFIRLYDHQVSDQGAFRASVVRPSLAWPAPKKPPGGASEHAKPQADSSVELTHGKGACVEASPFSLGLFFRLRENALSRRRDAWFFGFPNFCVWYPLQRHVVRQIVLLVIKRWRWSPLASALHGKPHRVIAGRELPTGGPCRQRSDPA